MKYWSNGNALDKDNIIASIISEINNGGYVLIRTDRYLIPGGREYHTMHFAHPMMIYGYDDELKEIYAIDANVGGVRWKLHTFSFAVIEEAFYSGLNILKNNFNAAFGRLEITTCCSFYPKSFNRPLKLKYIYDNVCINLRGGELKNSIVESENVTGEYPFPMKQLGNIKRIGVSTI